MARSSRLRGAKIFAYLTAAALLIAAGNDPCCPPWAPGRVHASAPETLPPDVLELPALSFGDLAGGDPGDAIPPALTSQDGHTVRLQGFIIPLDFDDQQRLREFILVKDQLACCFGAEPALNQWVHVTVAPDHTTSVQRDVPVWVWGRLEVGAVYEGGEVKSLYRLSATGGQ